MYLDNKYTKWYYKIIEVARKRVISAENSEIHHIIPESFFINRTRKGPKGWLEGDPEISENKVKLTAREHFVCHMLLVKMTSGISYKKMVHGLWMMTRNKEKRVKFTSRQYEFARKEFQKVIKLKKSNIRRPHTEAEKRAKSEKMRGIPKSQTTRLNMKKAWERRNRTVNESTKQKLKKSSIKYWEDEKIRSSQSDKRKSYLKKNTDAIKIMVRNINRQVTCQHCGIKTNIGNHNRWHGDVCKLNKNIAGELKLPKN